jgi:PAS domain S-box-containing protein
MMLRSDAPDLAPDKLYALWAGLTRELGNVFDAHGVCAAAAYEIAVLSGNTVVVGLSDQQGAYYDVWLCPPNGDITQTRWSHENASLDALLAGGDNGAAIWQSKYDLPAAEVMRSELWLQAREAVLMVSLPNPPTADNLVPAGALALLDPPADSWLTAENIAPLAQHITTFLERAVLRQKAMQQEVEFDLVYSLTFLLSQTLNLDRIFSAIIDPVRRMLNVETVSIGLVDPISAEILFVDALLGPEFQHLPQVRLQRGQGIAGWVAEHREPLIVNNVYKDRRFFARIDSKSGFRTHSILCVPLAVEEQVIGVLEAINKRSGDFSDSDLRLVQAITGPLAAAIQNAWLHADVLAEKRRVETIFANMSEGMLTVNAEGWVTAANDAFLTLSRNEEGDLTGQPAEEVVVIDAAGGFAAFMQQVMQATDSETPQLAGNLQQKNREWVPVLISGAPIQDEEGQISEAIYVFSDLRQIREVERMRDDFFHNIIHELRTPLATILMYARLLREGKARNDQPKADRFLGVIERESDRLQHMVRQMLQVVKLDARELQRSSGQVSLNQIFEEMLPPLADRATEKGLSFRQRIPPSLPPVNGDREMLYMIFKNLVENAIKFSLSGTIAVSGTVDGQMIQIEVQDEGIGIPTESIPNLFKRFYRTQRAVERGIAGTGLGLYMVMEGIDKHNGTLAVESVEGEGSTFTVRLPIAEE